MDPWKVTLKVKEIPPIEVKIDTEEDVTVLAEICTRKYPRSSLNSLTNG